LVRLSSTKAAKNADAFDLLSIIQQRTTPLQTRQKILAYWWIICPEEANRRPIRHARA
jgi:hypothetical protein